ncbi:MAG: choice-of-anchor B family protein [Pseudomonadota bacterium]
MNKNNNSRFLRATHCLTLLLAGSLLVAGPARGAGGEGFAISEARKARVAAEPVNRVEGPVVRAAACVDGMADEFACLNVDLQSWLPTSEIGGGDGTDLWGWTDRQTSKEYALMGTTTGTAFVDVTDSVNPVYLGFLPTQTVESPWRDIKVYADHAFIGADGGGPHGMQVFDLTRLRALTGAPPATLTPDTVYSEFNRSHNIVIDEQSGFAFAVGTNTCGAGLHIVDIRVPLSPTFAGCFDSDGYTHDAQCVTYNGPDRDFQGREICFNANEDTLTIVDVTDKASPAQLSRTGYSGSGYTHQGWLTEDQRYFLLDDEFDERDNGHNTRTRIWDVSDLTQPAIIGVSDGTTAAVDHNLYIHQGLVYQANYESGLRILAGADIASGTLTEIAWFDTHPEGNAASFKGAWSTYPYFDSGNVLVSTRDRGLFVVRPVGIVADTDGDGVFDTYDNCQQVANPAQTDTNGDRIGNVCDADIGGDAGPGRDDCAVNFADLGFLKAAFFSTPDDGNWNADADLGGNSDGSPDALINFADLARMKALFFAPPGPSSTPCSPLR